MTTTTAADHFGVPATPTVPYATPAPRPGARAWAGAAIIFGGLCLILLGGCFLIGVLALVSPSTVTGMNNGSQPPLTAPQMILMSVLYLLAFASFAGAAALLAAGARGLLRVMRG